MALEAISQEVFSLFMPQNASREVNISSKPISNNATRRPQSNEILLFFPPYCVYWQVLSLAQLTLVQIVLGKMREKFTPSRDLVSTSGFLWLNSVSLILFVNIMLNICHNFHVDLPILCACPAVINATRGCFAPIHGVFLYPLHPIAIIFTEFDTKVRTPRKLLYNFSTLLPKRKLF